MGTGEDVQMEFAVFRAIVRLTIAGVALYAPRSMGQDITFDAIPNQILGVSPFEIAAQASSGGPLGIVSNTSAVCRTASGLVTLLSAGTCSITASSSAASPVTRSFTVSLANHSGS